MTIERPLDGKLILVVEDDYFQADDARRALEAAGAKVLGPFADEIGALAHCAMARRIVLCWTSILDSDPR